MNPAPTRPDPDALLARLQREDARKKRGRLKIFFGACPGVGKTYAMLTAAQTLRNQGGVVVVGVVETHGRQETTQLLEGLEVLPRRSVLYKGRHLEEFDLDAALARRPGLILVDELAHANAPTSRHPKRWQDIEELLDAGIDVHTTVNVQHLESLHDVIGQITGIRVWERVPDRVIDQADEMVLVDLPPENLLQRLREGKIYLPAQAERAMEHFFRKGNLLALRELALRRTADRVDGDVRAWRREESVSTVWPIRERVLVCVGPGPDSERLVRRAARRANQTGAPWHALAIATPAWQSLPDQARTRVLDMLKLADELGAHTANVTAPDAVSAAIAYAREHNLGTLLVGRDRYRRLPWQHGFAEKLARQAPDLELLQVAREEERNPDTTRKPAGPPRVSAPNLLGSLLIITLVTLAGSPLHDILDPANIAMIYLLAVVFIALRLGRAAAVMAAFCAVAAFDVFYVPPRFTFAVHDAQYLVTFVVMLTVALVVGQLTAGLKFQAADARERERRMRALYQMARELSSALGVDQIVAICDSFFRRGFNAMVTLYIPDQQDSLAAIVGSTPGAETDAGIARWSFDHGQRAGIGTDTLPSSASLYIPLNIPERRCGVLAVTPGDSPWFLPPDQRQVMDTSATLVAIALERVYHATQARETQVAMASERLRNTLLSALSHDLRTPLTVIAGLAEAMQMAHPPLAEPYAGLARAIGDETARTTAMVTNLLDLARLQSGQVMLRRSWCPLDEVIGVSMNHCASLLVRHDLQIQLPDTLPLVDMDAALMERVFDNLLQNAAQHTPAGTRITLSAQVAGENLAITVADNGPGIPVALRPTLFDAFTRARQETSAAGFGLGLAIVRTIMTAHGGTVRVECPVEGGARFILGLPLGHPPELPAEPSE
ncbi:MAG: DUF4118 domain-containing protein [Magnetococcus sp. WYHC-3]